MKIYSIDFAPMWPVPSCLIIAAENETNALKLAEETITHTEVRWIKEIDTSKACVIKYESWDY